MEMSDDDSDMRPIAGGVSPIYTTYTPDSTTYSNTDGNYQESETYTQIELPTAPARHAIHSQIYIPDGSVDHDRPSSSQSILQTYPLIEDSESGLPESQSYTESTYDLGTQMQAQSVPTEYGIGSLEDRGDGEDASADPVIVNDNSSNNVRLDSTLQNVDIEDSNVPVSNNDTASIHLEGVETSRSGRNSQDNSANSKGRVRKSSPANEPPAKARKLELEEIEYDTCPICLDSYQSSGDHKIASLKCGHIFGSSCLKRWLKAVPIGARTCPTCKSKATVRDMRYIYAKRLVVEDSDKITQVLEENAKLRTEKNKIELELVKTTIACRAAQLETEVLRNLLMKSQSNTEPVRKQWRFALEKNLQLCSESACRVLTYNCRTYELYVSQKSMNNLFPGYGIRKVSCVDYKLGQFVHLHSKPVRDITYSQPRDLLLSVGMDCAARIVERGIPSITINVGVPLWSCSWDYMRTNEFYVGGVGGVVYQYDFRNPSTYLQTMRNSSDITPVAALCSMEYGLLSCQLKSSWLWVGSQRQWEPRALPVEGPFMSLCYDNESHRALVSTRSNMSTMEKAKLALCRFKSSLQGDVTVDVEETFNGSARTSLMTRPTWVKAPGASWIAAHSESDSALFLHGLDGSRTLTLHAAEPAIDVCSVQLNGNTLLAALSQSRLRIYKAVASS